jgi:DNA polymerase-3 subunit delta'
VVIIWLPEKMNKPTANKLLKIIEEPPSKTLFLMITENSANILPTIYSRVQMIKIPKLEEKEILLTLQQKYNFEEVKMKDAAHLADGNYLKALNVLEEAEENKLHFEKFTALMRLCWINDITGILNWVEEIARTGRESQKQFLDYGLRIIRENFLININQGISDEMNRMTQYESNFSVKFSKFIDKNNVFGIANGFNQASLHIEANANGKIVFLDMANKLAKLIKK